MWVKSLEISWNSADHRTQLGVPCPMTTWEEYIKSEGVWADVLWAPSTENLAILFLYFSPLKVRQWFLREPRGAVNRWWNSMRSLVTYIVRHDFLKYFEGQGVTKQGKVDQTLNYNVVSSGSLLANQSAQVKPPYIRQTGDCHNQFIIVPHNWRNQKDAHQKKKSPWSIEETCRNELVIWSAAVAGKQENTVSLQNPGAVLP